MNSRKLCNKMNTISMNSKNSKTSDFHRILLSLSYVALSNLSIYYVLKNIKNDKKTVNIKYQLRHGIKNWNYLTVHILYLILMIISSISSKKSNSN